MAERQREYHWFAEPRDGNTNNVLASQHSEEDFLRDVPDSDNVKHSVWRLNSQSMAFLRNSRSQRQLKFRLYVQEGSGLMRSTKFLEASRRKKTLAGISKLSAA